MSTPQVDKFDQWIRGEFKSLNSELEEIYFNQDDRFIVDGVGDSIKQQLLEQGDAFVADLLHEGNTDEGFDSGFDLLGNVGLFMAACRRHELTNPAQETSSPLKEASALAMQLGASLGVIPRFASAHLETHNQAIDGVFKTFTDLDDEKIFIDYNTRSVFAYIRASNALLYTLPLGVSHPATFDLLNDAKRALHAVLKNNAELYKKLDPERFYYCVRPYYKPYMVGRQEYRGANAGDFAGINVIDLLLGLCRGDDPYYSQILVDKFLYMRPDDQLVLRDCMRRPSLLDLFLQAADGSRDKAWFKSNAEVYLELCDLHGRTASQHHDMLVKKFIEQPTAQQGAEHRADLTASGPPLPELLASLKHLRDLRNAANVPNIKSRFADMQRLKQSLGIK